MTNTNFIGHRRDEMKKGIKKEEEVKGFISEETIADAMQTLEEYQKGKTKLESRIVANEQWYKMRHWEEIGATNNDPKPASAWLLNSILNKHADAMDNYPEPSVLPREENDKQDATKLSEILPVILEQNDFEQTYSDAWWYKLKTGTAVYGVFWDKSRENGLGDVNIKSLDLINLFWEPGIKDIQKSRNVFHVELVDNDILTSNYPILEGKLSSPTITLATYKTDDTIDTTNKSSVVDWYYKKSIETDLGAQITQLHYCKFVNGVVLYASENDPDYADKGFYDHGLYPFEFDTLFVEEGTPTGFGYIDMMKDAQMYIDKLDQIVLKNALMAGTPRYFVGDSANINEIEFADWAKAFVRVSGRVDDTNLKQIEVKTLDAYIVNHLETKKEELKETSGNRDFSQGGTTSGVTAASAIAALQEAGSKLSRDMIKSSYRAVTRINYLVLELIRQFYDEPRSFRITGDKGDTRFTQYDNSNIRPQSTEDDFELGLNEIGADTRKPVFDIKITSQKASPFSKIAQNELAKEMYQLQFFNPQMVDQALIAIEMMDFEGKDMVIEKIGQNGTLAQQMAMMQQQMQQMAMIVDAQNGTSITQGMQAEQQSQGSGAPPQQETSGGVQNNALGGEVSRAMPSTAKDKAQSVARPN